MKVIKHIKVLLLAILVCVPFSSHAKELEEIILYHYFTADPSAVDLHFSVSGEISSIQVLANKTADATHLESMRIDFGSFGSVELSSQEIGCIPEAFLKDLSLRVTSKPITAQNFKSWGSVLVIAFSPYHTDYSGQSGSYVVPTVSYKFHGNEITGVTIRNGKGDFVEVEQPGETCPIEEIEWALEGADQ